MDLKGETCAVCSEVIDADRVTLNKDIIHLFEFLIETIDTSAFNNALICTACLANVNKAFNFKTSCLVKQESRNLETDCDEQIVTCYICKNATKQNSSIPVFNSCYDNIVSYIIPKEGLGNLVNPQICDGCHTSALNFENTTQLLSVYNLSKTTNEQLNNEVVTDENEFKIDIVNTHSPVDSKLNIVTMEVKQEIKEETEGPEEIFQIKQEELDLKMECEAESSSAGFWSHTRQEVGKIECLSYDCSKNCNEIKMLKCQNCEFQAKYKSVLKKHELIHKDISSLEMFKCQNCDFQTKYKYSHKKHKLTHKDINELEMFKCENCEFQTKHKYSLKQHELIHKNINKPVMLKCKNCEFQTTHKSYLRKHEIIHKDINELEMFKCQQCEFQTKHKMSLKRHDVIHNNTNTVEIFKCFICEFQTKHKQNLALHMIVHKNITETEMFSCQNCEFQTKHKFDLKRHELLHKNITEIEMFSCQNCEFQTKHKFYLKRHELLHKNINELKMFKCTSCKYQTKHKSNLKKHVLIHKRIDEIQMP